MSFDDDLDIFLADFGVPVTVVSRGVASKMAIIDVIDDLLFDGVASSTRHVLTGRADVFGSLLESDEVIVESGRWAGNYFAKSKPEKADDGAFVSVSMELA